MRTAAPGASRGYPYGGTAYANPDAVTQIANGLSTTTFSYDADGNVTQKTVDGTTTTYIYDYANRLTALGVLGATTTYAYDWAGNRVSQTGTTTTYLTTANVPKPLALVRGRNGEADLDLVVIVRQEVHAEITD